MEKVDLRHENGQTLIYVALGMVVLLGFVALAIDVGYVYGERRRMQNAADAGALAGAHELCLGNGAGAAVATARDYATRNGAQSVVPSVDLSHFTVTVPVSETVSLRIAPVIGISTMIVPASAAAQCGQTCSGSGLWPLAFKLSTWQGLYNGGAGCGGKPFYVWNGNNDIKNPDCNECQCDVDGDGRQDMVDMDGRAWLDFSGAVDPLYHDQCVKNGCGASELGCLIRSNSGAKITLPQCVAGDNGVKAGVKNDVESRAGDIISIPLYDSQSCTPPAGSCSGSPYHVVQFGCVKVDSNPWDQNLQLVYKATGNGNCWKGKVIKVAVDCSNACQTNSGRVCGPPVPGGVNAVSLIQ